MIKSFKDILALSKLKVIEIRKLQAS